MNQGSQVREDGAASGVTVVLGVYNGARYLREQLDSIAAQSLPPAELIVADDGSTDSSLSIVRSFALEAPFPVTLLEHQRLGVAGNFLTAAQSARTRWVAWSDQDDVWLPEKIELCVRALEAHRAVLAFHNARVTDSSLRPTGRTFLRRRYDVVERFRGDPWECFSGFATVFERSLVDGLDVARLPLSASHGGVVHHDEAIHHLARLAGRRAIVHQHLALYRQHGANTAGISGRPKLGWRLRRDVRTRHRQLAAADSLLPWVQGIPRLSEDRDVVSDLRRLIARQRRRRRTFSVMAKFLR